MNIALSSALKRYVDEQVESGRYLDASEVVRTALRRMEAQVEAATGQVNTAAGAVLGARLESGQACQGCKNDSKHRTSPERGET